MGYLEAITHADRILVKKYIILPMILQAFERDARIIAESGNFKTPDVYVDVINKASEKVKEDFRDIKRGFFNKGLKVYDEQRDEDGIGVKFMCRGYRSEMNLRWDFLAAQAMVLMRKYLDLDISAYDNRPEHLRPE